MVHSRNRELLKLVSSINRYIMIRTRRHEKELRYGTKGSTSELAAKGRPRVYIHEQRSFVLAAKPLIGSGRPPGTVASATRLLKK